MSMSAPTDVPQVSVVTPLFNAEAYIGETVASVRAQSLDAWEMLVVDDGSSDAGPAAVEAHAADDGRVRLLRQPARSGALAARNLGLAEARGRFVAFLDADDLWLPEKLARQVAFMHDTGAAISHTGYRRVNAAGGQPGEVILPPDRLAYADLLKNTAINMSTGMVDTAAFGRVQVPERGHPSLRSDLRLWLMLLRGGAVARGLREDLARYRVVSGSLSANWLRSSRWVWRVYRDNESLGLLQAGWYFTNYGLRALAKRLR